MNGLRFVEKLANSPWLCDPGHVEFLHSIFLRYLDRVASGEKLDVRAVEQAVGRPLDNTRTVTNKDGVARIPVEGTIVRRANLFTEVSGGVSTETIAKDFVAAYNDASVHSILFVFDTPGGEAYGINELASLIREKRDEGAKRIEAFCDGMCASAGYYLASATGRITAETTASVGSIGTVVRVFNPQAAGKSPYLEFVNARSPNKRPDPNTAAGRSAIQEWIDDMGDQFIRFVADARGVSFEKVEQDFGQGFVMTGKRALAAGMVDALGSEGEVVGRLQEGAGVAEGGRALLPAASSRALAARPTKIVTHNPEEAATRMSENGIQTAAEGPEHTDAPAGDERRETGFMAHMRKFFVGEDPPATESRGSAQPTASARAEDEGAEANDGTREDMTETTQQTNGGGAEADAGSPSAEEVEYLRAQVEEYRGQLAALESEKAELVRRLADKEVEAEIAAAHLRGVEPRLTASAKPDLLEAAMEPENAPAQERAARWRSTLDASKGAVRFGEEGVEEGRGFEGMTDHERVEATLEARGLGKESYGAVASELAAAGEIRKGA
ncbi:hypothetical protein GBA65_14950 [Rubrobacter marinus]|uniref:Peptidase S49 domain-containing protein n=1 Tax=Rubrobacter marinus TaxID=2653852 RepID=A0A6G8PZI8_9ACTN|nr:S49 family peptidase [Rubrobacter marinus]QIN79605.1 hypothetical protein GBA65_14950 [Rubrobacter marinus]